MIPKEQINVIDLVEFGEGQLFLCDLPVKDSIKPARLIKDLSHIVKVSPDWGVGYYRLKADSRVGSVTTNGVRVQVRPALSAPEFCTLLTYAISGRVPSSSLRSFSKLRWDIGFEDALGSLLCDEAYQIRRIGLSRRYEEHSEAMDVIRGRPLWEKSFPWTKSHSTNIYCRYHRLTYDNIDNRILCAGLRRAWALASDEQTKTGLLQHLKLFAGMTSEISPDISEFEKAGNEYNRLNEHYRTAHDLSRLFLFSLRPKSPFVSGSHVIPGVVLDMADLFERFLEQFMGNLLASTGLKVLAQKADGHALLDGDGRHYASVRPDLEVWNSRHPVGVIDAKYKPYWKAMDDSLKPVRKIANEDLYQVFFYQQRLQHRHKLPTLPVALIASPLPEIDERNEISLISEKYRKVVFQAGSDRAGEVELILVPVTRFLRLIEKGIRIPEAINQIRDESLGYLLKKMVG